MTTTWLDGNYLVRFEARTLDDIRALGGNSMEDERQFAAVARLSEINLGLYRAFMQPWVKAWANAGFAEWMRKMHPLRFPYEMFTPANPFLKSVSSTAEHVRENRQLALAGQRLLAGAGEDGKAIESSLKAYGDMRDRFLETTFHAVYGSPVPASASRPEGLRRISTSPAWHRRGLPGLRRAARIDEITRNIAQGGPREAAIRALLYIRMPEGVADERGFRLLEHMREDTGSGLSLADFKTMVRDQFFTLLLDERATRSRPCQPCSTTILSSPSAWQVRSRKLTEVARRGKQARQEPTRRDDCDVRVEKGRKSSQEWCAERESHAASPTRPGASGEAASGPTSAI